MFHNTTKESGSLLEKAEAATKKQEEIVYEVFVKADREMSPSEVWEIVTELLGQAWPLTSVRRAISDLTSSGKLVQTKTKRIGLYGRPEYLWRLAL